MNRCLATLLVALVPAALLSVTAAPSASALTDAELAAKSSPADKAQAVLADLGKKNGGYRDMRSDVEMSIKDASGSEVKRHFHIDVLEKQAQDDGDRSLLTFDSPADVKGTALLSHAQPGGDDEQWVYLPSSKRVKRIAQTASSKSGAFMGSEFTYEDLTGADARRYDWTFLGTESCNGVTCAKLQATPRDGNSAYARRIVSIEIGQSRVQSVDFFDKGGALLKSLRDDNYTQVPGAAGSSYWRASSWTMDNKQTHRTTVLSFSGMKVGTGLSAGDFSSAKLDANR